MPDEPTIDRYGQQLMGPCPRCGHRSVMHVYFTRENGEHQHTWFVCTHWGLGRARCGWTGWQLPDWDGVTAFDDAFGIQATQAAGVLVIGPAPDVAAAVAVLSDDEPAEDVPLHDMTEREEQIYIRGQQSMIDQLRATLDRADCHPRPKDPTSS